jgi:threonylcarbamoyladenosine tRNA methylthiotransferase MtaB
VETTRVAYHTFGCKANQYDTERMRQELEARGAVTVEDWTDATVCVVNTCTVTNQADAQARRFIRRLERERPGIRVVVAGCSAALRGAEYRRMLEEGGVVEGHDAVEVARAALVGTVPGPGAPSPCGEAGAGDSRSALVQLGSRRRSLAEMDGEPVGGEILLRREGATRGWLKIQDGCDRKCAFCATRLARGASRSRSPEVVVREARLLAETHPELVLTGIHIGHYGRDLEPNRGGPWSLSRLLAHLLEEVPGPRFRLGSVEATEVDDFLLDLLADSGERVAPHLHMPLQSGADPVLRRMRRWHTREMYRSRTLEILDAMAARGSTTADGAPVLGLGADIITGFPGETDEDHAATVALVEELPYTYLHVFPFSPREGTVAAELVREIPVPQRVAGERSRELREIVQGKGEAYRRRRAGSRARVVLEGEGRSALTGDYLRVAVKGSHPHDHRVLQDAELAVLDGELSAVMRMGRWRKEWAPLP